MPIREADQVWRSAIVTAHLDDLANLVVDADRVAVYVKSVTDQCLHIRSPPLAVPLLLLKTMPHRCCPRTPTTSITRYLPGDELALSLTECQTPE